MAIVLYSNAIILFLRILTGMIAGGADALYTIIFFKVTNYQFPAVWPFITAFPIIGTSIIVLWNTIAVSTLFVSTPLSTKRGIRIWHLVFDLIATAILITLGVIAFVHDDSSYLSNGVWLQYDNGNWLGQEVVAGMLEIIVVVFQLIIGLLTYFSYRAVVRAEAAAALTNAMIPPVYEAAPPTTTQQQELPPAYIEEFGKRNGGFGAGDEKSEAEVREQIARLESLERTQKRVSLKKGKKGQMSV